MKNIVFLILLYSMAINLDAQSDIIYRVDRSKIRCKVTEITLDEVIKYKDADNLDGPVMNIASTEVFMIQYTNGKTWMPSTTTKSVTPAVQINHVNTARKILYPAPKFDKWGFIDSTGATMIDFKFDKASAFSNNLALVVINSKYGYCNYKGDVVISCQWQNAVDFFGTIAAVSDGSKFHFIDNTGAKIGDQEFDEFENGYSDAKHVLIKVGNKYYYVNEKLQSSNAYDDCSAFKEGLAAVKINDKWGIIDSTYQYVLQPVYDGYCALESKYACGGGVIVMYAGKTGIAFDKTGNEIKRYTNLQYTPMTNIGNGKFRTFYGGWLSNANPIFDIGGNKLDPAIMSGDKSRWEIRDIGGNRFEVYTIVGCDDCEYSDGDTYYITDDNFNLLFRLQGPWVRGINSEGVMCCKNYSTKKYVFIDQAGNKLFDASTDYLDGFNPFKDGLIFCTIMDAGNRKYLYMNKKGEIVYGPVLGQM